MTGTVLYKVFLKYCSYLFLGELESWGEAEVGTGTRTATVIQKTGTIGPKFDEGKECQQQHWKQQQQQSPTQRLDINFTQQQPQPVAEI